MNKNNLTVLFAIIVGVILGMSWYIFGKFFSEKTENPFRVNPIFSIVIGILIAVGVVIYWRRK